MDNTGGIIKIVFESFCLTVTKNFVVEPFSPSLISGIEKTYASEGLSRLSVENFFSHTREKFRRGNFLCCCFSYFLVAKRYMDRTGGIIKIVFENFCLTVPKNFVVEPFSPSLMSSIEKIYASEGYVTIFRRKFLVPQCRKRPYGNPLLFQHFQVSKNFMLQMVMSRFSVESFLSHSPE